MKLKILFLFFIFGVLNDGISQSYENHYSNDSLNLRFKISREDSIYAQKIPKLTLNPFNKNNIILPYKVDNSEKIYLPPIFGFQYYANCGQISGIYNTYSYEVNRLLKRNGKRVENQFSPDYNLIISGQVIGNTIRSWTDIKNVGTLTMADLSKSETLNYIIDSRVMMPNSYLTYYHAMFHKIDSYYAIDTKTEEGILTLKHWLHNRLNGETDGGVAIIYLAMTADQGGAIEYGPERGKNVIVSFPNFANHSVAVVGYNDSVFWDYNNDGLITNDLDINNDGKIDVRDWEKGAFIIANSYGTDWGNAGYMYFMYNSFAASEDNQCIWNNTAYVVNPKLPEPPKLTFKLKMNHSSRNNIQARIGVSNDIHKTTPDYSIIVPFINFQDNYLQAFTSSRYDTTLAAEFGIDLTPLLNYIEPNKETRFFFTIYENDPNSKYSGYIKDFSLINYSHGQEVTNHSNSIVYINNNGITTLWLDTKVDFKKPELLINKIPNALINEEYHANLVGKNGNPPYSFSISSSYSIEQKAANIPSNGEVFAENVDYHFIKGIKPHFPIKIFDIKWEDSIYVSSNGTIQLYKQNPQWPFVFMDEVMILSTPIFAPFLSYMKYDNPSHKIIVNNTDSIFYVRWNGRNIDYANSHYDFGIQIKPTGEVAFEYYNMDSTIALQHTKGISKGDGRTIVQPDFISYPRLNTAYIYKLSSPDTLLQIQPSGAVYGKPTTQFLNHKIPVTISDNSGILNIDTIVFSTGERLNLEISQITLSPFKEKYNIGDTVFIGFKIKNNSSNIQNNIRVDLANNSQNILVFNNSTNINRINPNEELNLNNVFKIKVLDNYYIDKLAQLVLFSSTNNIEQKVIELILLNKSCSLEIGEPYTFNPQLLDVHAGNTYTFNVPISNQSGDIVRNIKGIISCNNPEINILRSTVERDSLMNNSYDTLIFVIAVSSNYKKGEFVDINININLEACSGYHFTHQLYGNKYDNIETYEDSTNLFFLPSDENQFTLFTNSFDTLTNHSLNTFKIIDSLRYYYRTISANFITGGRGSLKYKIQSNTTNNTLRPRLYITDSDTTRTYYLSNLDDTCNWERVEFRLNKGISSLEIKLRFYGGGSILLDDLTIPDYYQTENFNITPQTLFLKANVGQNFSSGFYINSTEDVGSIANLKYSSPPYKNISWLNIPNKQIRIKEGSVFVPITVNTEFLSEGNYEAFIMAEGKNHTDYVRIVLDISDGFLSPTESSVAVYPNPTSVNYVSTDFTCEDETECRFTLYNILGNMVYDKTQTTYPGSGIKTLQWNFSETGATLTKGLYLYRFKIGDKIYSGKIISTY